MIKLMDKKIFTFLRSKSDNEPNEPVNGLADVEYSSDFIWDFGKLPFPSYLGKYFMKIGKISTKIHDIGKIKAFLYPATKVW